MAALQVLRVQGPAMLACRGAEAAGTLPSARVHAFEAWPIERHMTVAWDSLL